MGEAYDKFMNQFMPYLLNGADKSKLRTRLRELVREIEGEYLAKAKSKLAKATREHERLTLNWNDASDMQRAVFKKKCNELEPEILHWQERTKPISQRLRENYRETSDAVFKQNELMDELPQMTQREKGEAFRRVFKTVALFWGDKFIPKSKSPTRTPKTKRSGRHRYTLLKNKTGWNFTSLNLDGSS